MKHIIILAYILCTIGNSANQTTMATTCWCYNCCGTCCGGIKTTAGQVEGNGADKINHESQNNNANKRNDFIKTPAGQRESNGTHEDEHESQNNNADEPINEPIKTNIIPEGTDEYKLVETLKSLVDNPKTKYDKNTASDVTKSTYGNCECYNVPFFNPYNNWSAFYIPFAFELGKEYFYQFPEEMQNAIIRYLNTSNVKQEDFHIFVTLQDLSFAFDWGGADSSKDILFRPHFFIAKQEIDGSEQRQGYIYGEPAASNICIIYNNNRKIFNRNVTSFSLHDSSLSAFTPRIDKKISDFSENIVKYYSFVLEKTKNIAALTIHFLMKRNTDVAAAQVYGTINGAIDFCGNDNKNSEFKTFLDLITINE